MIQLERLMEAVYGKGILVGLEALPVGAVFVYFWRRYGPPNTGSDDYKDLCAYRFDVMEDVRIVVRLSATRAWINVACSREVADKFDAEMGAYILQPYYTRRKQWAKDNGMKWMEGDWMDITRNPKRYEKVNTNNQAIMKAYEKATGDKPDTQNPTLFGPYMTQVYAALEAQLRDWLKMVSVRDVYVNILGEVPDGSPLWKDQIRDEDGEFEGYTQEVERHPMSGYGYGWVEDFNTRPEGYVEYLTATAPLRKAIP